MINLNNLLNIKINKIYCISLEKRKDRREYLETQFEKLDHEVNFHIVKKNSDPIRGCLESHIECIKEAKELEYENILMLEDDILINEKVVEDIEKVYIPEDFDMFYLGYHINNGFKFGKNILKLLSAQTTHAYIINKRVFDFILNNIENDWSTISEWSLRNKYESLTNYNVRAIDLFYSKWIHHHRLKTYGIYPMLIHQKPDFSDIENRQIDYRDLMNNKADEFYKVIPYKFDTWILNLEKRKDRWDNMVKVVDEYKINAYKIKAIDGMLFNFEKYMELFSLRDYKLRNKNPYKSHENNRGVLGCALSHYKMWESLLNNKEMNNEDYVLIIEDDCYFIDNFDTRLNILLDELKFQTWDICFVGYTDYVSLNDDKIIKDTNLIKLSGSRRLRGGGTFGYLITKNGAKKLYNLANDRCIQQAIDWFMIEQYDKLNVFKTQTDLIYSNIAGENGHDSDIQNVIKPFYNIELKIVKFRNTNFLKDQYNNLFTFEHPFKIHYMGNIVNKNQIIIKKFHNELAKTKFEFVRGNEYVAIYVGNKMKILVHYFAKFLQKKLNKKLIIFSDNFDFQLDNIQYIHENKLDKLNNILKFTHIFVFNPIFFLSNFIKPFNKIFVIEDGEFFYDIKFNNFVLPNSGIYLFQNLLENIDKVICFSETSKHYFKLQSGIKDDIMVLPPVFDSEDILIDEEKLNINENDILLISYDLDVKTIINYFHKLNITNKKLLVFSDVFQPIDDNIIIKPTIYKLNFSYLNYGTFFITQSRNSDNYFALNLSFQKGLTCIIPEYYRELSSKTITFENNLDETKEKVENCSSQKLKIYKNIGRSYYMTLFKKLEDSKIF